MDDKTWNTTPRGGVNAANLLRFLTNLIYGGKIIHKGNIYPGEHEAIVDEGLWEEINAALRSGRRSPNSVLPNKQDALVTGILCCGSCDRQMVPTYTAKGLRRAITSWT